MTPQEMKEKREKKKLTQIDVAIKVGVSVGAYRLWEQGGSKPKPKNEIKLKEILG